MADINWIKLKIDMFDDEKIKMIQSLPEGDSILVIWIRLIVLAGKCNANGFVLMDEEFPYNDEMLAVIFNKPMSTIRLALATFERYKMIENTTKGIYITNFEKHQNIDGMDKIREQNRLRKQRQREKQKEMLLGEDDTIPEIPFTDNDTDDSDCVTCHVTVTEKSCEVTQQRENKNKSKNIYNISSYEDIVGETPTKPTEESKTERLSYDEIMNDYNQTCISLPRIRAVSESRRRSIRTLLRELEKLKIYPEFTPYEKLHCIFKMADNSDFLSGRSKKWDGCSFDWLINKSNALKVLEGNYENKGGGNGGRHDPGNNKQNTAEPDGTTSEALERFRRNQCRDTDL